jgi:hypothetical protein
MLAEFGTGQVFWSMLWFFLFFIWIWLLITIFADIFRSHDLSGWGKAVWVIFVILLPYLGVFVYLIANGHGMAERNVQAANQQREQLRQVVGYSAADELEKLDQLKASGKLSDAEYQQLRGQVVSR